MPAFLSHLLLLLVGAAAAPLAASADDVQGWWRAAVQHDGQSDDIYLHFQVRDGHRVATFSIPSVGTDEGAIGPYEATPGKVRLTGIGWELGRNPDGSLSADLPEALVPHYKMPAKFRRSASPTISAPPSPTQTAPAPLWKHSVGAPVTSDVAYDPVAQRILVATLAGDVIALNPRTGARAWSTNIGSPIRGEPVVAGGAIFAATDSKVAKIDARTGAVIWSAGLGTPLKPIVPITDPNSEWDHYSAAPVVDRGRVYVGSRDGCVHAFDQADGSEVRKYCTKAAITGRPVVAGDRIFYASFDGRVYAARLSDGTPLWSHDTHGPVPRDLALSGKNILAGSRSYDLVALNRETGSQSWTHYTWWSWVDSEASVGAKDILVGSSDAQRVYKLDPRTGRATWTTYLGGWAWARPARGTTVVYTGLVGTATPYVGKRDGGLAALDARTGRLKWVLRTPHGAKDPTYGFAAAPLVVGRRLYAADLNGTLFAFRAE